MPEDLLVGRQQPALDRAGVGVRGQPGRGRAGRPAADSVGVGGVPVRVEPDPPPGPVLPERVQEPPDRDHVVVLPGLYLRLGPVDGVNRWFARCQATEDPVVDGAVRFGKTVSFGVTGKLRIPALGALPGEGVPYHDASTTADRLDRPGRHGP